MNWARAAAFIVPVITLAGAVITAGATFGLNQWAARRERLARTFAEALAAIEDYAQMPYRIRRRPGTLEARNQISMEHSNSQSRIAFQHAWLHIEAADVAAAYDLLIRAAWAEAGFQMKEAWTRPAPTADEQMTLETTYPRMHLDSARSQCITCRPACIMPPTGAIDRPGPARKPGLRNTCAASQRSREERNSRRWHSHSGNGGDGEDVRVRAHRARCAGSAGRR